MLIKTIESPEYSGTYKAKFFSDRNRYHENRAGVWEQKKLFGLIVYWEYLGDDEVTYNNWLKPEGLERAVIKQYNSTLHDIEKKKREDAVEQRVRRNWLYELLFPR